MPPLQPVELYVLNSSQWLASELSGAVAIYNSVHVEIFTQVHSIKNLFEF